MHGVALFINRIFWLVHFINGHHVGQRGRVSCVFGTNLKAKLIMRLNGIEFDCVVRILYLESSGLIVVEEVKLKLAVWYHITALDVDWRLDIVAALLVVEPPVLLVAVGPFVIGRRLALVYEEAIAADFGR